MSWCRALPIVLHVLRWVVSSGEGHPVWMRGILAFEGAELWMFWGGGLPWAPVALLPVGLMPRRGTRIPWMGWCQDGSGCQMGAGRPRYCAQVYTVYVVPSVSDSNPYVDFRALP